MKGRPFSNNVAKDDPRCRSLVSRILILVVVIWPLGGSAENALQLVFSAEASKGGFSSSQMVSLGQCGTRSFALNDSSVYAVSWAQENSNLYIVSIRRSGKVLANARVSDSMKAGQILFKDDMLLVKYMRAESFSQNLEDGEARRAPGSQQKKTVFPVGLWEILVLLAALTVLVAFLVFVELRSRN